jgi:hypothetical protein
MSEVISTPARRGPRPKAADKLARSTLRRFSAPHNASSGETARGTGRTEIVLPAYHPAARGGRSIFPSRVFAPDELPRLLKSGHQSRKIGKLVTKGKRRGWPIYTLTLEERASCPRSCREWHACYGNHMHAAERIEHGPAMLEPLALELCDLARAHPQGFLVRLHVLGDFWSVEYVRFWSKMLGALPMLAVFGFTAHAPASPIGHEVALMEADHGWARAAIRFSGEPHEHRASRVIGPGETDPDAITCPAQTGGTDCCGTCALCWHSDRSIAFKRH